MKKIVTLLMMILLLSVPEKVQASTGYWTQDKIEVDKRQTDDKTVIALSTEEMQKEYGYIAFQGQIQNVQHTLEDKKDFRGVWVPCELGTTAPLFMSISLEDSNNNRISLKVDATFAQTKENTILLYSFEEGNYKISSSLEGKFFFPFSAFEENSKFSWKDLRFYTINLVIPRNAEVTLTIGEAQEKAIEQKAFQEGENFKVIGDATLELPIHGESMGSYGVTQEDFSIRLFQEMEGVCFENGVLKVNERAKEGTVIVEASNGEGIYLYKEVELKKSLRSSADFLPVFPAPEEVTPILIPVKELSDEATLLWIRIGVLGMTIIVVTVYTIYYQKAMTEWKEEQ